MKISVTRQYAMSDLMLKLVFDNLKIKSIQEIHFNVLKINISTNEKTK